MQDGVRGVNSLMECVGPTNLDAAWDALTSHAVWFGTVGGPTLTKKMLIISFVLCGVQFSGTCAVCARSHEGPKSEKTIFIYLFIQLL